MLVANTTRTPMVAAYAERSDGPFYCPECAGAVVLKKGKVVVHHFAHETGSSCTFGTGESEMHRRSKWDIFRSLESYGIECKLEHPIGSQRADVYAMIGGEPVAIEVQASALTADDIARRTVGYTASGLATIWVLTRSALPNNMAIFRPSEHARFLHRLGFGRVYYHWEGHFVVPVHFSPSYRWVESTDWGGGYYKRHKSLRRAYASGSISLLEFASRRRPTWQDVPSCMLWQDRLPRWWSTKESEVPA